MADQIFGSGGNDTLYGGRGSDSLYGGMGNDLLDGGGGSDLLDGGAGRDVVDYSAVKSAVFADLAAGTVSFPGQPWGAERLISIEGVRGGSGDDSLFGSAGDDWLDGGDGADTLDGGSGTDTASYRWATTHLSVVLDSEGTASLGAVTDTLRSIEVFASGSGNDWITAGGESWSWAITVYGGSGNDAITGSARDDLLAGEAGGDTLSGGDGNDTLWGGGGTDVLDGGAGQDIAVYSDNTSAVLADLRSGRVSFPGRTWAAEQLVSIEGVETGSGNDRLIGTGGANDLRAGAGTDTLFGAAGNDTLDGGLGRDVVNGGAGADTVSYASHRAGVTIDLARQVAAVRGTTAHTDRLISIEHATGGTGADRILGSVGGDRLDGGAGDDTVMGGVGNDVLSGGDGDDLVLGGAGNDTISGGTTKYGSVSEESDWDHGYDRVLSWLVDDGADTLDGGSGIDTLLIRDVSFAPYHNLDDGLLNAEIDLSLGTLRLGVPRASTDILVSIENVATGGGNDTVTGSDGANHISVGAGVNVVFGGGGNDTIVGGDYANYEDVDWDETPYLDRLHGGDGDDLIESQGSWVGDWWGSAGQDYLDGGAGNDTLVGGESSGMYMVGGDGTDVFVFDNEVFSLDGYGYAPSGQNVTIADFERASGDKLQIVVSGGEYETTPTYVGEVASVYDLGESEVGYARVTDEWGGQSTLVRLNHVESDQTHEEDVYSLNITLAGYTGDLQASDFLFV